ncbi:altronate dehydratase family protein [Bacteroides sp. OttesenSCG-928-D19]|nr:altronate dehydratase family protein [Bacteroides sp. OttesenSCG-928-D19]
MLTYIQINPADNVIVAVEDIPAGTGIVVGDKLITVKQDIPAGHKIALQDFLPGDHIIKYGFPIGHATTPIGVGEWVNEKNIKTNLEGLQEYTYNPQPAPALSKAAPLTFNGYRRANGEVGIRNEVWIVPTVGCINGIAQRLATLLEKETRLEGNVDSIVAWPHNYGCSQLGDDHENTRKILRNLVLHPNAGAVLVVGLGCENNQVSAFREFLGEYDTNRIRFMETQKVDDELETGMQILHQLYSIAAKDERTEVPMSELKVGLKCGGSDGFSGITANPLLGVFSDYLVAQGGTTVLTEVPEMFGAETILMDRSETGQVFDKTVHLINDFKSYFIDNKQPIYENPSPGNKAGGISTLEEKSLGCTQKAGSSLVRDVLLYGQRLSTKGLNLLSAPGNDLVASTALAASGCHIVLFTTGRGTPFGTFVPTMKISTNSNLYIRKPNWIDFNAGSLLEGETMENLCNRFIQYIIGVANGTPVNNEKSGYREIAIFKTGVTL